ncbi:MAG: cytochrome c3 family protein [Planctomycetota bacterium]|nr:cytochrome c3 family protein [Planctomycetota bacterium]
MGTRRVWTVFMVCLGLGFSAAGAGADECSVCHEKEARAESGGLHRRADVSCVDCHRGDPDAKEKASAHGEMMGFRGPIHREETPELCGGCHTEEAKYLGKGDHGGLVFTEDDEQISCTHCHASHRVEEAWPGLFDVFCIRCHEEGDRGYRVARSLKSAISRGEEMVLRMEGMAAETSSHFGPALDEARTLAFSLGPLQHMVRPDEVNRRAEQIHEILGETLKAYGEMQEVKETRIRNRKLSIPLIWAVVALNCLLFYLVRRSWRPPEPPPPETA